jgi:hypothetical protein
MSGPALLRQATVDPGSVDKAARRVRVSFSSEQPVLRSSWFDEDWIEILGHESGEVDLARINAGGPVLYNHNRYAPEQRLGKVERAWLDKGRAYADLVFSRRPEVDGYWQDIEDGILTNVSVGYSIHERMLLQRSPGQPPEYRVTKWEPGEISLVDMPADHTVGVGRAAGEPAPHYTITSLPASGAAIGDPAMTDAPRDDQPAGEQHRQAPPDNVTDLSAVREAARREGAQLALSQERARQQAISQLCAPLRRRLPWLEELETRALHGDMSVEQVSAEILRRMGAESAPAAADLEPGGRVVAGEDQRDKTRAAGVNALLWRADTRQLVAADGAKRQIDLTGNPFRGATLLQMAERCLRAAGVNPDGLDKRDLVGRAFQTTSDFAVILEDAIHKQLLGAYRLAPRSWADICAVTSVGDFREHKRYRLGSIGTYDALDEHGEFRRKTIPDAERYGISASPHGNMIAVSREVIINDDLGAFMGLAQQFGRAGGLTVETAVWAMFAENAGAGPLLADGYALFATQHSNIEATTVGVPGTATIEASAVLMSQQKDPSGNEYLDIQPAIWVGPRGLRGHAQTANDSQYSTDAAPATKVQWQPNIVRGYFSNVVGSPRLTGNPWYLFADPSEVPTFMVAFLDGEQEPYIETRDGWTVDGAEIKARLDFGVAAVDYRGAVKNNGG